MGLKESGLRGSLRSVSTDVFTIPDSVVDRWPLDEGSGQTGTNSKADDDLSFNFENWASGDYVGGFAKEFDGIDDEGDAENTAPNGSVALYATVSFESDITDTETVMGFGDATDGSGSTAIGIELVDTNDVRLAVRDGNGDFFTTTTDLGGTGTFRVVGWYDDDDTEIGIAVDGGEENTRSVADSDFGGLADFSVGYDRANDRRYYGGILDEPMIGDEVPTPGDLTEDYERQPWS